MRASSFSASQRRQARSLALSIEKELPPAELTRLHPSLGMGHGALALFFAQLASSYGGTSPNFRRHRRRAVEHLQAAIAGLENVPFAPSLIGGLAGVGWVATHLEQLGLVRLPEELYEDIDIQLLSAIETGGVVEAELISGSAGLGVYALARARQHKAIALLQACVSNIDARSVSAGDEACYWTDVAVSESPARQTGTWLGVAHGAAGIIAFLARAHGEGVTDAGTLAQRGMRWLTAQEVALGGETFFPNRAGTDPRSDQTLLAWCHGDLGIACVMHVYEGSLASAAESAHLSRLRARLAKRGPAASGASFDTSLCHGGFGNAHLFHLLHQRYGDPPFGELARAWWDATYMSRRPGPLSHAFAIRSAADPLGDAVPEDFLTGLVGSGLVALAIANDAAGWDAPLLVDGLGA